VILPFTKGVSSSDEIGSILCTTDNERAIPKRRTKHRPKDPHHKRLTPTRTPPGFFYTGTQPSRVQRGSADGWSEVKPTFHSGKYEVAFTDANDVPPKHLFKEEKWRATLYWMFGGLRTA